MTLQNASYSNFSPRDVVTKLNAAINGGGNNTGDVTLTANVSSTTVVDTRVSPSSVIILMPTTANAAIAISTTYFSVTLGSFTVNHANNSQTDRTFKYATIGG